MRHAALAALAALSISAPEVARAQSCRGKQDCGPFSVCSVELGACGGSGMLDVCSGQCVSGQTWRATARLGAGVTLGEQAAFTPALSVEVAPPILDGNLGVEVAWWPGALARAGANLTFAVLPEDLRVGVGLGATTRTFAQVGASAHGRLVYTAWSMLRGLTPARFASLTLDAGALVWDGAAPRPFATLSLDVWF